MDDSIFWKADLQRHSCVFCREEYRYTTAKALNGYPYWGEMAVYGGGGKAGASTYLEVCACVWLYWTLWTGYWTFSKVQQDSKRRRGSDDTFHSEALLRGNDAHKQYLGCFQSMDAHRQSTGTIHSCRHTTVYVNSYMYLYMYIYTYMNLFIYSAYIDGCHVHVRYIYIYLYIHCIYIQHIYIYIHMFRIYI